MTREQVTHGTTRGRVRRNGGAVKRVVMNRQAFGKVARGKTPKTYSTS